MPDRIRTNTPGGPAATTSSPGTYTVRPGDTLGGIAGRNGTTVAALVEANRARYPSLATDPGRISVGWQLTLPAGGQPPRTEEPQPNRAWQPRSNDEILFLGMNKDSQHEVDQLRARGAKVTYVKDGFANDQIKVTSGGRTTAYDLSTPEGSKSFALTLGLPPQQTEQVAQVIHSAGDDARDEVAQIAQVWAKAERGEMMPSRLVLSGHNVGSGVWGDNNGRVSFDTLGDLAAAMPRAARSVEDLHLAACYSGGVHLMDKYRGMFPNVKTIWAYAGSAPGSYSGATAHESRWESATRGTRADLDREIARHTRKGENVAVWSRDHGYVDGNPPAALADVRREYEGTLPEFDRHFSGASPVTDPQSGPLRDYYNRLQRVLQHPQLPAADRSGLEARRDTTIRLIFYPTMVAPKFSEHHRDAIRSGFDSVGLPPPNFASLSRADALAKIAEFEAKVSQARPPPAAASRLLPLLTDGLRDLKRSVIPDGWV